MFEKEKIVLREIADLLKKCTNRVMLFAAVMHLYEGLILGTLITLNTEDSFIFLLN
jgi:hypothetical protein